MILHLGMSGSLRVLPAATPPLLHDHVDIVLDSGACLRFNDPRRFGSLLWTSEDPLQHPLLKSLAPEPLSRSSMPTIWRRRERPPRRDQAVDDEQPGRRRRRQYLRERSAVSRRHPAARAAGRLKREEFERW